MRWPILCLLFLTCAPASAGSAAPADPPPKAQEVIRRFVAEEVARAEPGLRAEIAVGEVDPHLRLAPCERTEAFLRSGARLWGRVFVGYRCLQHPGWSVSVPVTVRLYGPALVAIRAVPALQAIAPDALRVEEVDLTREPGGVARELAQVEDRVCTHPVEAGQAIALNSLRTVPVVGQGDPVRLVGVGNGFSISTNGTALASAAAGQMVRVETESGRTIAGIARKGRLVEVAF
jgi:flagella basal body P-ring formation protein FlgA